MSKQSTVFDKDEALFKRKGQEVWVYDEKKNLIGYAAFGFYSPMSNFHLSKFKYRDHEFQYAEQAIMWSKAKLFGDEDKALEILNTTRPTDARQIGRKIDNFNENQWRVWMADNMVDLLYAKYDQNSSLRNWLLETGKANLAELAYEESPGVVKYKDYVWGIALCGSDPEVKTPQYWNMFGLNLLGEFTKKVRNRFEDENREMMVNMILGKNKSESLTQDKEEEKNEKLGEKKPRKKRSRHN